MGRQWAVYLGAMTFATGVMTQQWSAMITGVVYSVMTAAAMWENFRARLPYLYDPWSEKLPPAPTLMHAMIAISAMAEGGAVTSGVAALFARGDGAWIAMVAGYGVSAVIVSVFVASFLEPGRPGGRDMVLASGAKAAMERDGLRGDRGGARGVARGRGTFLYLAAPSLSTGSGATRRGGSPDGRVSAYECWFCW